MLTDKQISELYKVFGSGKNYRSFELAAKAYYLMVSKHISLTAAVREVTGQKIGFRVSDAISAGSNLFTRDVTTNRYVPLGYLVTYNVNISGGGSLTFSLWFPFYYDDFYKVGRTVSRYLTSRAGAFSYTVQTAPFVNRGTFRITIGKRIIEGIFKYQWSDDLCYFEIEIQRDCRTGRVISRRSVKLQKCNFIPPEVPSELQICVNVPPFKFETPPGCTIPENTMSETYAELQPQLSSRNYDLFRTAMCAYQLMVEKDYPFSEVTREVANFEGISVSTLRNYMIKSQLVVKATPPATPPRSPERQYDPYGNEVEYVAYTKESPGKKAKGTVLELRFKIWQPFYADIPFDNIFQVVGVLFDSLGSAGVENESIILGMLKAAHYDSLADIDKILSEKPKEIVSRKTIFRNRDKYTISVVKESGEAWRYDGIYRYQWSFNTVCKLDIETLRICARKYGAKDEKWSLYEREREVIITDDGFELPDCPWRFDERLRYSEDVLNFKTVCTFGKSLSQS